MFARILEVVDLSSAHATLCDDLAKASFGLPWPTPPASSQLQELTELHYPSAISLARARSFSVSLLSWPQAARMSRPRGVRTGEA